MRVQTDTAAVGRLQVRRRLPFWAYALWEQKRKMTLAAISLCGGVAIAIPGGPLWMRVVGCVIAAASLGVVLIDVESEDWRRDWETWMQLPDSERERIRMRPRR